MCYFCSMSKSPFQIGDQVSMINDTASGVVVEINDNMIVVQSEDGFISNCEAKEIVKKGNLHDFLNNENHDEFLKENLSDRKKVIPKNYSKKNNFIPMEVDLHINQLVNSSKGMSNFEILDLQINFAKRKLEFAIRNNIQKIVFIHGVGEGVLKSELNFLFKKYAIESYDASYQKYGYGATEIYINQNSNVTS